MEMEIEIETRTGVVEARRQGRRFLFVRPTDRGFQHPVFCHLANCKSPNGHECLFTPNVPVVFKINAGERPSATDVRIDEARCSLEIPEVETSEIHTCFDGAHYGYGFCN